MRAVAIEGDFRLSSAGEGRSPLPNSGLEKSGMVGVDGCLVSWPWCLA